MKVLIINGSHRAGNTDIAVDKVLSELHKRGDIAVQLKLRDIEMMMPDGCVACCESKDCPNVKDQFSKEIEPDLHDYDVYIIATPTWSDTITPLTNIFWQRIVTWDNDDRQYLKGKKLAVITHGQAGMKSWKNVINWAKSVCVWEKCIFTGALTFKSGAKPGVLRLTSLQVEKFVDLLTAKVE